MSEQVRIKGSIHEVTSMFFNTTLEQLCSYELLKLNNYEEFELPKSYESYEEYLLDKYYEKYIVRKGRLYEINVKNCYSDDEFFESKYVNSGGKMEFHAYYHNGGFSLHEAINECMDNVK